MPEAEPVIIDDGGSTRIKQLKDSAKMDDLLGNSAGAFTDKADGTFTDSGGTFLCTLKVRFNGKDGSHSILPDNGAGTPSGLALLSTDSVVVLSKNGQKLTLTFDAAFRLVITLNATVAGIEPIVEAKQDGKQRRYIVTNAGPIRTVSFVRGGAETFIAHFSGPPPVPGFPTTPSIYTMLHLRAKPLT